MQGTSGHEALCQVIDLLGFLALAPAAAANDVLGAALNLS